MVDYPQTAGKYGPIYQIAEGVRVGLNEFGSWEVLLKRGGERKKKAVGRGEENFQRAVTGAELLAKKLG